MRMPLAEASTFPPARLQMTSPPSSTLFTPQPAFGQKKLDKLRGQHLRTPYKTF